MKTKQIITCMATLAVIAGFTTRVLADEEEESTISMDKVPAAVKKALAKYAPDAEVKGVEISKQDGKKVFEFDIVQGTNKLEVAFSKKGKFKGTEQDVEWSTLPEAAQKGLTDLADGGKLSGFEMAVDDDKNVTYEADLDKDGKKSDVTVNANGKAIKSDSEKEGDDEKEGKGEKEDKD